MAGTQSISATGKSIERVLNACLDGLTFSGSAAKAALVRTEDFDSEATMTPRPDTGISIFLHRVVINGTMRAAWSAVGSGDGDLHLPLDLHYVLTPWATNAEDEHHILGLAMACLETRPILRGPLLESSAGWAPDEAVQLIPEDLSSDVLGRMFDSLPTAYRLSVGYVARIVRIDAPVLAPPTVTTLVTGLAPTG